MLSKNNLKNIKMKTNFIILMSSVVFAGFMYNDFFISVFAGIYIFLGFLSCYISAWFDKSKRRTIQQIEEDRRKWARQMFPTANALSSLEKLRKEIDEIEEDIKNGKRRPVEYADAIFLLFDSASLQDDPIYPDEIFAEAEKKLIINKSRKWEDNGDGTYSHIK